MFIVNVDLICVLIFLCVDVFGLFVKNFVVGCGVLIVEVLLV